MILLKVLRLFEDLFVDLVAVDGWVAVLCEEHDEVDFQLGLDVRARAPVGVLALSSTTTLHLLGELEQFVLGVVEVVLVGEVLRMS